MRVAILYPMAAWSTRDVATGYARAFERLGHAVTRLDLWEAACRASGASEPRFYARALEAPPRLAALREALAALRSAPPDWLVVVHGRDVPPDLPDDVRKRGTRSAVLLTDEPYELSLSRQYARGYDLVITNDPATLETHRADGLNTHYLPLAYDPEVMRPDPEVTYAYDVAFVGTWFRNRVDFFERLWSEIAPRPHLLSGYWLRPGDRLPPEEMPGDSPLAARVKPAIVWPEELCRVYQRTRIALNLHRGSLWHANPDAVAARGVNPRLFEIAGAGTFQLVDDRPEVRACFDPDEIPSFTDATACAALIQAWLSPGREPARRATATRALARARAAHTYEARARSLAAWMEAS